MDPPSVLLMAIFILVPIIFVFRMALSDVSKAGLIKASPDWKISAR